MKRNFLISFFRVTSSALVGLLVLAALPVAQAQNSVPAPSPNLSPVQVQALATQAQALAPKVVAWRRDIHANPELGGQEVRTAALVAEHLRKLDMEVQTGVGGTGVVGLLKGAKPGKTVALRADMDALPVAENTGLPFASKARGKHLGVDSPVMHACGHDGHVAILMGVAELLSGMRGQIAGQVKFVFQPAEEGPSQIPSGTPEAHGAKAMVQQGAMQGVDAVYGLHLSSVAPFGVVGYRSGPLLSGSDSFRIKVTGKQTHGAAPWSGVDPIVVSSQIVLGLQTLVSRQLDISKEPAVITIGSINGGNRSNIIPDDVQMQGTLRTFDEQMRTDAKKRITTTVESIAAASGAKGEVEFSHYGYSVTSNPESLVPASVAVLRATADGKVMVVPKITASEDFSEFQKVVPGFFFMLGGKPKDRVVAPNHSPQFDFDEDVLPIGVRSLAGLALDFLAQDGK